MAPQYKKDIKVLKYIQRQATKMTEDCRIHPVRGRRHGLSSVEKRRRSAHRGTRLFSPVTDGQWYKAAPEEVQSGYKEKILYQYSGSHPMPVGGHEAVGNAVTFGQPQVLRQLTQ